MPTAGDYEIEFALHGSRKPDGEHQESIWYEAGVVCTVRLDEFAVEICRDGVDRVWDDKLQREYRYCEEFPDEIKTDKDLIEAFDTNRFHSENNSWFDIYISDGGEHLDMVTHSFDEAFDSACDYLIEQFSNMCQIENNQTPQVEGRRVVVVDFSE
jgi:hypothetical protein